jgi:4-amino-4-deoxy-L-arabinose transferase-like glycosyltransferase
LKSESPLGTSTRALLVAVAGVTAALHVIGLDRVPIHLHHDEIYFGLIADSVAHSMTDPQGRWLPLLFQMGDTHHWYPPVHIYVTALWLRVVAISDVTVRLPNAFLGVANVVTMFFVARRMFGSERLGLAAAAMLAITPAHFINSRISTDCLYPVTFILLWLLLLLRYLETPTTARLIAAAAVLGVGMYAYIASVIMMPIYLLLMLALLVSARKTARELLTAALAFAITMIPGAVFAMTHPDIVGSYAAKYELASAGPSLNPFQMIREALTPWNISDHLNLFHSSFSPGYLFVTGGSNLAHSTRMAGVFLAPMAILLVAGVVTVIRRPVAMRLVILAGFFTAPAAAALVREDFAIPRMLGLLPFGVLLATLGLETLWTLPLSHSPRRPATVAAAIVVATGSVYLLVMLLRQSHLSWSALLLIAIGIAIWGVGAACGAQRSWQPVAAAALVLMPLQFAWFAADYFGDYRARSAARYEYNIRGAIEQAIAIHDRTAAPYIYFNDDILFVRGFWDYYLRVLRRRELRDQAMWFNSENGLPADIAAGSLVVTDANGRAMQRLTTDRSLARVAEASDPIPGSNPPAEQATFVLFQKR